MHDEQTSLPKQLPEQLRAFLAEEGFGSLAAGLSFAHARQYSTVWTAELLHPTGPAVLQLFTRGRLRGSLTSWFGDGRRHERRSPACAVEHICHGGLTFLTAELSETYAMIRACW